MAKGNSKKSNGNDSGLNFEAQLWADADNYAWVQLLIHQRNSKENQYVV